MILSDKSIKEALKSKQISIEPYDEKFLQPSSYDLHLDKYFLVFDRESHSLIDIKQPVDGYMREIVIDDEDQGFIIHPGEFVLANAKEITGVDDEHVGRLEGKSSLARIGLLIHATAGFLDPGNKLRMTLEMVNLSPLPIKIYPGMKIAQMAFEKLDCRCSRAYGSKELHSKYVGDEKVKASLYWKNFKQK